MESAIYAEIANRARVLAELGPENAERLRRAQNDVGLCRDDPAHNQHLQAAIHNVACYQEQRREVLELAAELMGLVYRHLPDAEIRYLDRLSPDCDWNPVVDELHQLKDAACRKAAKDVSQDPPAKRRYNWDAIYGEAAKLITGQEESLQWNNARWARELHVTAQSLWHSEAEGPNRVANLIRARRAMNVRQ